MTICRNCEREFKGLRKGARFCSEKCRITWQLMDKTLTPYEEMLLKDMLKEETHPRTCDGCAYQCSNRCGKVRKVVVSSSSYLYRKFRDGRCRQTDGQG